MLSRRDREGIVDYLETEFREDLPIHLYSTFLLHRINPVFPRRNWASWPLPIEEVPDPGSSRKYVDNEFLTHWKDYMKEDDFHDDQRSSNSEEGEFSSSDPEEIEEQEDHSEESSNGKFSNDTAYLKVRSVTNITSMTENKIDLLIELQALVEKKLHSKLQRLNDVQEKTAPFTSDFECGVGDEICKKLGNKIDQFVGSIIESQIRGSKKTNSRRAHDRLLNWQDVLLAGLNVEKRHRGRVISTDRYRRLYEKCERLFARVRYDYEYENHTDDYSASEDEQQEESSQNRRGNSFNYLDHVCMLEETQNSINYKNFRERVLTSRQRERILSATKQYLFANKLELEDRYKDLTWNNEEKRPRNISGRTKKKFRISQSPQSKENALNHGGISLTAEDFTLDV